METALLTTGFHYGNVGCMDHPLKRWRQDRGLSQTAAAELLELTRQALCRYETGARMPPLVQAAKLSEKTGIPLSRFVSQESGQ